MDVAAKKGILLVNLGTPDAPTRNAVKRYLTEFLLDPRVVDYPWLARNLLVRGIIAPFRSGKSAKLYQHLWTPEGSPLKVYGEQVAAGLQQLMGETYQVELAMRYQQPSIPAALDRLARNQVSDILVVPLFPQYASATTGSIHEAVMKVVRKWESIPEIRFINSYYNYGPLVDIFAENARAFDLASYDHILFSYHGLPQRQLKKADLTGKHCLQKSDCCASVCTTNQFCYSAQCHSTTAAIVEKLGLDASRYTTTFQSRLGPEAWAQPYTSAVLTEQAAKGAKRLLVFSPAFVADCLETLIEIKVEYQDLFTSLGGERVDLVPSLNDNPEWIKGLAGLVRAAKN